MQKTKAKPQPPSPDDYVTNGTTMSRLSDIASTIPHPCQGTSKPIGYGGHVPGKPGKVGVSYHQLSATVYNDLPVRVLNNVPVAVRTTRNALHAPVSLPVLCQQERAGIQAEFQRGFRAEYKSTAINHG